MLTEVTYLKDKKKKGVRLKINLKIDLKFAPTACLAIFVGK